MPFKSKAQQRKCYAMKAKNQTGSWDCSEWSKSTDFKKLPKRKKQAAWIVANYLGWAFLRYSLSAEELNELITVSQLAIVFDLIDIINVYLFLKIVQTISSIHNHIFNN